MTKRLDSETVRRAQADNPKMRARDLATSLGISEAEYVAAWCGHGTRRIAVDFDRIFPALEGVGEVMGLTRNESAVHEKIGVYDKYVGGKHAAMMLGEAIDTRMFPARWVHGFAVESRDDGDVRRSLQFFDAAGEAVHKIHARPATDTQAWDRLVAGLAVADQSPSVETQAQAGSKAGDPYDPAPVEQLRESWSRMTDTHQFFPLLRKLKFERLDAVRKVGADYAWQIDNSAVHAMMKLAAAESLQIMCFVGNEGCIQIHSGEIATIREMGPWLNVMDPAFHLHLRTDHIAEVWAVRKPTDKGHVTSLEAYGADGELIIQFFGKRIEGQDERPGWRMIMENLPRISGPKAA